ncbi:FAD-dependent 5-carboxymethylaminomethyl-2-thiouridine(34) oxidoreductase MnmC [Shewanella sedimentimangrovi]|uniref:FAD-dependent 5-carboxymethylaminomethyl-2-thiouridine(34) oxidoreductase MnmC n=1 Tax=Shewanella sedimentimangrovi TaxID=2814293 RepID=A0ABX7QWR2_9GAMM|nr:FAD-dependent 5-carboxymethylaminomethyl-2-thiouridine(34) oxidoreductase MnmC [Shewanella sedimentimangrovi]QSX35942.1 FAD-dependent 5-carboxymethylaminomethyl-2-thiouridine(34) oxidoreductase MnmC [Shewanella sedimentimangrovi]
MQHRVNALTPTEPGFLSYHAQLLPLKNQALDRRATLVLHASKPEHLAGADSLLRALLTEGLSLKLLLCCDSMPKLNTLYSNTKFEKDHSVFKQLLECEPLALKEGQRLQLEDGGLWLDLHLGDVATTLAALPCGPQGAVDAWLELLPSRELLRLSRDGALCLAEGTRHELDLSERLALWHEYRCKHRLPLTVGTVEPKTTAIIGGGIAGACMALALTMRGQRVSLFCATDELAGAASGNRQGAIYPLLTPEDGELCRFFIQAFLYSRRVIEQLQSAGHAIAHDFCGVLQTGHDQRSAERLEKIIQASHWPDRIARRVDAAEGAKLAGLGIDNPGIFYLLGGWVSPAEFCRAAVAQAQQSGLLDLHLGTRVKALKQLEQLKQLEHGWQLEGTEGALGEFDQLVLACGEGIMQFAQTRSLPVSPFRGQVSHVPSQGALPQLKTVLCSQGYFTPGHMGSHCMGASYVKGAQDGHYSEAEQRGNLDKMRDSYPQQQWLEDLDISAQSARVGVRMVTRDHFPMMGAVPDTQALMDMYQAQGVGPAAASFWQHRALPELPGLYMLAGLGSRGISSAPLAAECLADMMQGEVPPLSQALLDAMAPSRMWQRKLLKGKSLD